MKELTSKRAGEHTFKAPPPTSLPRCLPDAAVPMVHFPNLTIRESLDKTLNIAHKLFKKFENIKCFSIYFMTY